LDVTLKIGDTETTCFAQFRREFRVVKQHVFAIFSATSSKARLLAPTAKEDPSSHGGDYPHFQPFYKFSTMDIHTSSDYTNPFDPKRLAVLGRPLWHTLAYEGGVFDAFRLVKIAKEKLVCSQDLDLTRPFNDLWRARKLTAAILGVRVHLEILNMRLAKDLVASHMRVLRGLSQERLLALTGCPSEPILVEAAAQLMEFFVGKLYSTLFSMLLESWIPPGDAGELIAKLILLHAADLVPKEESGPFRYSQPFTLEKYLTSLFPHHFTELDEEIKKNPKYRKTWNQLLVGSICLTHWIKVSDYFPDSDQLLSIRRRCAGTAAKDNERTLDLVIPVALPDDKLALIAIQVKNRVELETREAEAFQSKLYSFANPEPKQAHRRPTFGNIPILGIFMELRRGKQKTSQEPLVKWMNHKPGFAKQAPSNILTLRVNGCSSKIYPIGSMEKEVVDILKTRPIPLDPFPEESDKWSEYVKLEQIAK
jgi:hypothetical protein